ncbi:MAG: ATP-binding protein [Myxococcaceae bacterium]
MSATALLTPRGRILLFGTTKQAGGLGERLSQVGYDVVTANDPGQVVSVAAAHHPEAIVFTHAGEAEGRALELIRADVRLRDVPTLANVSTGDVEAFRKLRFDDFIRSPDELTQRLEAALRARRALAREAKTQARMETLLEIAQAATSSRELDDVLRLAAERTANAVGADRCSVVLVEGDGPIEASLVASNQSLHLAPAILDLAKYPELRRALSTRQSVHVAEVATDPLMAEVRASVLETGVRGVLVQPLVCQDDVLGALLLHHLQPDARFGREEQEFVRAVAAALSNSIRNARLHATLKRKREELESAYVDRYRELNEANKRLKELNRLKDEIIAVASHDVRAPLNVLLGHGQLLLDSDLAPQQVQSAEAIVRQGRKILSLVESLLERGKSDAGRLSLDARLIDVAELCQEGSREIEILAANRGVSVRCEAPESLLAIGDEVKLREVLQNLLTNAIQHAREGGGIVVRAQRLRRPDGEVARVSVQDDGAGVPEEELHLIFDRYRHGPGGTGLGLAICKEFVDLHGGEIWAETPQEGGAAFVFTLPLAQEHSPALRAPPPALLREQARVLVVEDEPDIAAVLVEILRARYRVEIARDGAEGLAKARALRPDLIVMDVFLPKLDGLDAAVALKSSNDTAHIPVILLSAHQGVADKVRSLNLGAVDYLGKPFQAMELLSRTERALKLQRAEKELERSTLLLRRTGNDPDTGLLDRAGLAARMEPELARSRRYARPLSVVVLSADAQTAPEKLRQAASLVRRRLRSPDLVGHLGAGRFALVMPECGGADAATVARRLVAELQTDAQVTFAYRVEQVTAEEWQLEAILERISKDTAPSNSPR